MNKNENALVDIVKIVMALFVFCIHIRPIESYSEIWDFYFIAGICRVAVPVFFIYAGYYFFNKPNNYTVKQVIHSKYYKRIFQMYFIWMLIYSPIYIRILVKNKVNLENIIFEYIRDFLFVGFKQYWYLLALLTGLIIVTFLFANIQNKTIVFLCGLLLYSVGLLCDGYNAFLEKFRPIAFLLEKIFQLFVTPRNGLFFAPIFLITGYFLAQKNINISFKKTTWCIIIFVLFLIRFTEMILLKNSSIAVGYTMTLSILPLSLAIVLMSLNIKIKLSSAFSKTLRKLSTLLYLIHTVISFVIDKIIDNLIICFFLTLLISFIISLYIIYQSKKQNWIGRFLKKIY